MGSSEVVAGRITPASTRPGVNGWDSNVGVAALYASGGTAVNDRIALGRDRVKIAIAQGGNAKSGAFHIVVAD